MFTQNLDETPHLLRRRGQRKYYQHFHANKRIIYRKRPIRKKYRLLRFPRNILQTTHLVFKVVYSNILFLFLSLSLLYIYTAISTQDFSNIIRPRRDFDSVTRIQFHISNLLITTVFIRLLRQTNQTSIRSWVERETFPPRPRLIHKLELEINFIFKVSISINSSSTGKDSSLKLFKCLDIHIPWVCQTWG